MTLFLRILGSLFMVFVPVCAQGGQSLSSIESQGTTDLATTAGNMVVRVVIKTHEVQVSRPSDGRPSHVQSSCTYSKFPCSLVDSIEIAVNGNPLFVPRSVFCDLADLHKAEIRAGDGNSMITLFGGDASESYIVKIEFDESQVRRRVLSSALSPDQTLQETIYHVQVLGE